MKAEIPQYHAQIKNLADYARSRDRAGRLFAAGQPKSAAATTPESRRAECRRFGILPCLESEWGIDYLRQLYNFIDQYRPGCPGTRRLVSGRHMRLDLTRDTRAGGFTMEAVEEDHRFLQMVPRQRHLPQCARLVLPEREQQDRPWATGKRTGRCPEQQEIIERQNIFDGTWEKTPSMGWMFVPLAEYHGGGAAATIEPLSEHLTALRQRLANLFGAGVQACYRGPRLYDSQETEALVKKWVGFLQKSSRFSTAISFTSVAPTAAIRTASFMSTRRARERSADAL